MQGCSSYCKCWCKNYFLSVYLSSPNLKSLFSVSRRAVSQFTQNIKKIQLQLFSLLPYYNIYQEMPSCHSPDSFSPETQIQSQWVTVGLWIGVALVQGYVSGLIYTVSCQPTPAAHWPNLSQTPPALSHTLLGYTHTKLDLYLTLRRRMSHIYGAPILDVSRSHTTTQHSR